MLVVLEPSATDEQIQAVEKRLREEAHLHIKRVPGEIQTAIGAIGDPRAVREMGLEGMSGVESVIPVSKPYKLASLEINHNTPSTLKIGETGSQTVEVGPRTFSIIAGPCTVESQEQTIEAAKAVARGGASMLRGGLFKPRTSPFSFQGLGEAGIEILAEARELTGLPVVSEAKAPEQVEILADSGAIDVIQIGARNMQNYDLLAEAGRGKLPVLLKRSLSATLEELLMAADYILAAGNERVILCERGIRTFESATRFTLDISAVPWLKLHTHLPVIVDPSHAPGDRRLVEALSSAAAAAGADGVIVETTPDPESARCDGPQQIATKDFARYANKVFAHSHIEGRSRPWREPE